MILCPHTITFTTVPHDKRPSFTVQSPQSLFTLQPDQEDDNNVMSPLLQSVINYYNQTAASVYDCPDLATIIH